MFRSSPSGRHCQHLRARTRYTYHCHPALWFYDAWNEPVSRPLGQCQCPHSVASYRAWLKQRYGSIVGLNEAWGKAWTSFDTIHLPVAPRSEWERSDCQPRTDGLRLPAGGTWVGEMPLIPS
ncbi:MAG: beta-galactosidase [Verrucomicrobia bacterium]|nr:beta-galactosidase [Verrucomicrobiota bacterium]